MIRHLVLLSAFLGISFASAAGAVVVHGEASLDARARSGQGATTLEIFEARAALQSTLAPRLELYTDAGVRDGRGVIDEAYADWRGGDARLRLGRFFLPIGIHSRSELYYTGFVRLPFVKYYPFNGFVLFRSEQGAAVAGGPPRLRYEVGVVGDDGSQAALGLDRPEEIALRLQSFDGHLIWGANGYAGTTRPPSPPPTPSGRRAVRLVGLDWRYSLPEWIVRGEWWMGRVGGRSLAGGYVDLLYHPEPLPAWTFVLRVEQVDFRRTLRRGTLGAKHVPARGWTIALNWVLEDPRYDARGVSFQVLRTVQF